MIPKYWVELPVLYNRSLQVICSMPSLNHCSARCLYHLHVSVMLWLKTKNLYLPMPWPVLKRCVHWFHIHWLHFRHRVSWWFQMLVKYRCSWSEGHSLCGKTNKNKQSVSQTAVYFPKRTHLVGTVNTYFTDKCINSYLVLITSNNCFSTLKK